MYMYIYLLRFQNRERRNRAQRDEETEHREICCLRIRVVISPANKHNYASTHDIETGSLFFDQSCTLPRKSTPPLFLCLLATTTIEAKRRGRRRARDPRRAAVKSVFLRQFPLLVEVKLRRTSRSSQAWRRRHWCNQGLRFSQLFFFWYPWKMMRLWGIERDKKKQTLEFGDFLGVRRFFWVSNGKETYLKEESLGFRIYNGFFRNINFSI